MSIDPYQELRSLVEKGNEEKIRSFVVEHLKEFSKEDQEQIIFDLFEEALEKEVADTEGLVDMQKKGAAIVGELENAQEKLADKSKLLDIKESL